MLPLLIASQAIVDGDPPDLPNGDAYSDAARNFVSGCLNKIPNLRPTYAMLLQHAWLAPLVKPDTIIEEDEDAEEEAPAPEAAKDESPVALKIATSDVVDQEVADWVLQAIEKRRKGTLGKSAKPALHAAPLDAVKTPGLDSAQMKANVKAMMESREDGGASEMPKIPATDPSPKNTDAKDFATVETNTTTEEEKNGEDKTA